LILKLDEEVFSFAGVNTIHWLFSSGLLFIRLHFSFSVAQAQIPSVPQFHFTYVDYTQGSCRRVSKRAVL